MKAGAEYGRVLQTLRGKGLDDRAALAANCGLPGETLCTTLRSAPAHSGYFTTFLVPADGDGTIVINGKGEGGHGAFCGGWSRRAGSDHAAGGGVAAAGGCGHLRGSLVNPALLEKTRPGAQIYNSAEMTLEEVLERMRQAETQGQDTVRLHTGDASLYGAVREQMDALDALGIPWDDTPGVSSFCGAAAALGAEYTLPGVSQTLILTRMAGRTGVPEPGKPARPRCPRRIHGDLPLLRQDGGGAAGIAGRGIPGGHPRRHCLQSHLARRARGALYRRYAGRRRRGGGHHQNGAFADRGFSGHRLYAQQTLRPVLHHRISKGARGMSVALLSFSARGQVVARAPGGGFGRHGTALRRCCVPLRLDKESF